MCFRTETFSLLRAADAHDQADQRPGDHAFRPGASGRGEVRTLVGAGGFFATKFAYVRFGHSKGISTPGGLVGPDVYRPDNVARRAAS